MWGWVLERRRQGHAGTAPGRRCRRGARPPLRLPVWIHLPEPELTDVGQKRFSCSLSIRWAPRCGGLRLSFSTPCGWENVFPGAWGAHAAWSVSEPLSLLLSSLSLFSLLLPSLSFWKHLEILISHPPIHQSWAGGLRWAGWVGPLHSPPVPFPGSPSKATRRFSAPPRPGRPSRDRLSHRVLFYVFLYFDKTLSAGERNSPLSK